MINTTDRDQGYVAALPLTQNCPIHIFRSHLSLSFPHSSSSTSSSASSSFLKINCINKPIHYFISDQIVNMPRSGKDFSYKGSGTNSKVSTTIFCRSKTLANDMMSKRETIGAPATTLAALTQTPTTTQTGQSCHPVPCHPQTIIPLARPQICQASSDEFPSPVTGPTITPTPMGALITITAMVARLILLLVGRNRWDLTEC